jgi:hypothetical protein
MTVKLESFLFSLPRPRSFTFMLDLVSALPNAENFSYPLTSIVLLL